MGGGHQGGKRDSKAAAPGTADSEQGLLLRASRRGPGHEHPGSLCILGTMGHTLPTFTDLPLSRELGA